MCVCAVAVIVTAYGNVIIGDERYCHNNEQCVGMFCVAAARVLSRSTLQCTHFSDDNNDDDEDTHTHTGAAWWVVTAKYTRIGQHCG